MDVSGRELARYLNCSPRTIGRLVQDGVLSRERSGKFRLQQSIRATVNYYKRRAHEAEHVCRVLMPGELEAYRETHCLSDEDDRPDQSAD